MCTPLLLSVDKAKHGNAAVQRQLEDARRECTVELHKSRVAAERADERSRSTEKRILLDMDRARTASAKLQKELEALTAESLRVAGEPRKELNKLQQTLGASRQKNSQLEGVLQAVTASLDRPCLEAQQLQTQLSKYNHQTMHFH